MCHGISVMKGLKIQYQWVLSWNLVKLFEKDETRHFIIPQLSISQFWNFFDAHTKFQVKGHYNDQKGFLLTRIILAEKGIAKTPKKDCIYTIDKIWVSKEVFKSTFSVCNESCKGCYNESCEGCYNLMVNIQTC